MDKIDWGGLADLLESTFDCMTTCDIQRMVKTQDAIGGDIEQVFTILTNEPCYISRHPFYTTAVSDLEYGVKRTGNFRIHLHPKTDVIDGDIVVVHDRPERKFIVTRTACYPSHTRLEVQIWDNLG